MAEYLEDISGKFRRIMKKRRWKRKTAVVLTVAMLTGTFANGLTVTTPSGRAYAYASASDALVDDILDEDQILSEDLPAKGESIDYYMEDAAEVDLVISEEQIQKALEETEPELDLALLGYEDPRAVVGLYEEIKKATEGYRLADQGTLAEDELSYFVYIKEDIEGGDLFEKLYVIVVNPSDATDADGRYNVFLKYNGGKYRLEAGSVQLKSLSALSREQLKADELDDEPDIRIEMNAGGSVGGGSGSGSGDSAGGGSIQQDSVVIVEPEKTNGASDNENPETDAAGDETSSADESKETDGADASEAENNGNHAGDSADTENGSDRGDSADTENGSDSGDSAGTENGSDSGSSADAENGSGTDGSADTENGSDGGDSADTGNSSDRDDSTDTGNSSDAGDSSDTENGSGSGDSSDTGNGSDAEAGSDESSDSGSDAGDAGDSGNDSGDASDGGNDAGDAGDSGSDSGDTSDGGSDSGDASDGGSDSGDSGDGGSGSGSGEKLSMSIRAVERVMAVIASFSDADAEGQIDDLKKELKSLKQKALSLEDSGSFEMSTLEMKLINQDEISDEDILEQADEDTPLVRKLMRSVPFFGGTDDIAENDIIESETAEHSSAMGLRANTIAMFRADAVPVLLMQGEGDFAQTPEKLYAGVGQDLLENVAFTDENGDIIDNVQITVADVTRTLKSGETDGGWSWDQNSVLSADSENVRSYEVTYRAWNEAEGIDFTKTVSIPVHRVVLTVPEMEHLIYLNTYTLIPAESLAVDEADEKIEYPIRVTSVTRKLVQGASGVDEWTWNGEDSITIERPDIESYTITYEAYDENSGQAVSEPLTRVVSIFRKGGIGETLDTAGDMAYLDAVYVEGSLRTGTAPFDKEEKPGNDTTELDDILRTFDTVSYTVQLRSTVRPDSPYDHYENGTVCFEFILPTTSDKAIFDEGAMSWLQAKPYAAYEISELDGRQVLRGSFLWTPNETNDSAIGESYMELNVAVRALAMKNDDTLKPVSTFWLGVNNIAGDNGSLVFDSDNGHAIGYDFPSGIVTDSGYACPVHKNTADEPEQEIEFKTVECPEVKISAAPRYNLRMAYDGSINTSRGEEGGFRFGTGKNGEKGAPGTAPNFDENLVVEEGRVGSFGVVVQIQGKTGQGLRGVEMPDTSKPITFDLTVSSVFRKKDPETNTSVTVGPVDDKYRPLLWSVEGNRSGSTQSDGRKIVNVSADYARNTPFNKGGNATSCYDGGNWGAWQEGNTIHVTVTDYKLNFDPISKIPYHVPSSGSESKTFYDPDKVVNYWEIDTICISAGEFWLLQPFTSIDGTNTNILEENGVSSGAFNLTVRNGNLQMTGESGNTLPVVSGTSNQSTTSDDAVYPAYDYLMPGSFDTIIKYTRYRGSWDQPLTEGCSSNGGDWATLGTNMTLQAYLSHDGKDGDYFGVAYDILLKFDDAMFQPNGTASPTANGTLGATLYGVVKGRETLGWDHNGLAPDQDGYDDHLINADVGDLEFYTWDEYKKHQDEDGYTCVAVLQEWRGLNKAQMVHNHSFIHGSVKLDPELGGNVYMISQTARVWRKCEVKSLVQEKYGLSADTEPTDAQYTEYAKNDFPSQSMDAYNGIGYEAYPKAGHSDGPKNDPLIKNFEKSRYYSDGTVESLSAGDHYGDSCYIVNYKATLSKNVTQVTVDSTTEDSKLVYDLDNSQRVADYRIDPMIHRAQGILGSGTDAKFFVENLTITDTLPAGLTYIPGSAHLGGTYSMYTNGSGKRVEGVQGSVQGGELLEPEVSTDGRTLTWVIAPELYDPELSENDPDQRKGIWVNASGDTAVPSIYYSCDIGHVGADDDVVHNQQLENVAVITARGLTTDYSEADGNQATLSIQVSKMTSVSLSKTADQSAVEVGDPMNFTMKVGNNSNNVMEVIAYDTVPYNGDKNGSYFGSGECVLTEWRIDLDQTGGKEILEAGGFRFFYTEEKEYADKSSSDFMEDKTLKPELITDSADWHEVDITWDEDEQCYKVNLPEGAKPTAVAAIGALPGLSTLPMHTTIRLTDPKPGDCVSTTLSNKDMRSTARSFVLNRSLEGLVWYDFNYNGVQDDGEQKLNGITVTLLKKVNDRYLPYENVQTTTGHSYDLFTKETAEIETGRYQFNNLPAGDYAVEFSSGSSEGSNLSTYLVTKKAVGNNRFNSDADEIMKNGLLVAAEITDNTMPEKDKIQTINYTLSYLDLGLARPKGNLKFDKTDSVTNQQIADVDGDGIADVEFSLTGKAFSINGVSDPVYEMSAREFVNAVVKDAAAFGIETTAAPSSGKDSLTVKFRAVNGHVDFSVGELGMILPRGRYTLMETKVPAGYTGTDPVKFEIYPDLGKDSTRLADYTIGSSGSIDNTPQEFKVLKVRDEDGSALEGAEFAVMKENDVLQQITMENGVGVFYRSGLREDTLYTLVETTTPAGYQTVNPIGFRLKAAGNDKFRLELSGSYEYAKLEDDGIQIKVTNTPDTGSLTIKKELIGDAADIVAGADKKFDFTIRLTPMTGYQLAESSVLQKDASGNITGIKAEKDGRSIVLPVEGSGEIQIEGLKAGEAVRIGGLYYGTRYVIIEDTSVETGYEFAGADSDGTVDVDTGKAQVSGTIQKEQENRFVAMKNQIRTTSLTLGKTFDSDIPETLPVFEIYDITGKAAFVSANEAVGDRVLVGTIQIAESNGSYYGTSDKVLKPGHEYQVVEKLAPEQYPAYSPKVSERITVSVGSGNNLVLNPEQITISNTRDKGWITVRKTLKSYDGDEIAEGRDFYYKILREDESALTLIGGGEIARIRSGEDAHRYFVDFGKYRVVEVTADGAEYGGSDAEYLVENPDPVDVELKKPANDYTTNTEIVNRENALGELAIVKKANYAEKGQKFYFQVKDSKGHYITQAGDRIEAGLVDGGSVDKTGVLWTISVSQTVDYSDTGVEEIGQVKVGKKIPYGIYTVTETDENGDPVDAYSVSYQTAVGNDQTDYNNGEIDMDDKSMTVTVTNQVKKGRLRITKTFDSHVPESLPKFEIYQVGTSSNWKVDEVQIEKQSDGTFSAEADGLLPGYEYYAVEVFDPEDENSKLYDPITTERKTVVLGDDGDSIPTLEYQVDNERKNGYLAVSKKLFTYYDEEFYDAERVFYYVIKDRDGNRVEIPEEYRSELAAHDEYVAQITGGENDINRHLLPYGRYTVEEVDENGKAYEDKGFLGIFAGSNPNPLYEVTNPDSVTLGPSNGDGLAVTIKNKERPLGKLTVTKKADYAEKGDTFYFKVTDERGQYVSAEGKLSDEFTKAALWTIKVSEDQSYAGDSDTVPLYEIGSETAEELPYGKYTVTETDADGNPLGEDFAYTVSYTVEVNGKTAEDGNSGEMDYQNQEMTVTVSNKVNRTYLTITKTFDSHVPDSDKLPVFAVYHVNDDVIATAGEASRYVQVATASVALTADGVYTGKTEKVLIPGYRYQAIEILNPEDAASELYDPIVTDVLTAELEKDGAEITPLTYTAENIRNYGYLYIRKELLDYYGETLDDQRTFYYSIWDVENEAYLSLPDEYLASSGNSKVGRIQNGEEAHRIRVPYGKYRIDETDAEGIPYEDEKHSLLDGLFGGNGNRVKNPLYTVDSPDKIIVDLSNADAAAATISNAERALGRLTITKRTDWAEDGRTEFYFTVKNERTGELVDAPVSGLEAVGKLFAGADAKKIWVIRADAATDTMSHVGSLTAENLPYGTYIVTEVDENGNPLPDDYPYDVSYQVKVSGETEGTESGTMTGNAAVTGDYRNPNMEVTVTNTRSWGYIKIQKRLQDFHGTDFRDGTREFFYTVLDDDGKAVALPEEYQYDGKSGIGRITDEQTHTLFVPYGVYKVMETDRNGRIYDGQNPNPLYEVTNPDPVELGLANADTALAVIVNRERALGTLSVTKVVNRASAGTKFYFTVANSKGELMKMPDENGNPTGEDIWYLTVQQAISSSTVVGTRTLKNIPYDTYTVTETKENGEPLTKTYVYRVSYETTAMGETTKTQTGTITIAQPDMSVTVTNTRSGGGGGGGGGGGSDPDPDPTPPSPTTPTTPDPTPSNPGGSSDGGGGLPPGVIFDDLIPLGGGYYRNPADGSIIYIGDEDVPLLGLARTGDEGSAAEVMLLLASVMGIAALLLVRRRKKDSSDD